MRHRVKQALTPRSARARAIRPSCAFQLERLPAVAEALARGRHRRRRSAAARAAGEAADAMAAVRRERSGFALALGDRRPRRALPLEEVIGAAVRPRRPAARAGARRGDRRADAGRGAARLRDHRARQAGRPRAQLFVRRRPHLPLRSRDPAAEAARGAGPGGAADRPARRRDPAEADRGRLCLPGRPAPAARRPK